MASAGRPARRALSWLALSWLGRACVVTAVVGTVAGCVNMPDSGPTGAVSASPQSTAAGGDFIEPVPSGPAPGEMPADIVNGFLAASASYPVNAGIARQYLLGSATRKWRLGWSVTVFSNLNVTPAAAAPPGHGSRQAIVNAFGNVQSTFDGNGQFVSAQIKADKTRTWLFHLVQVGGQWRISNPPTFRLLNVSQFTDFYSARDLYFVNPYVAGLSNQSLVPASVFVPIGTSTVDTATKLVNALLPDPAVQPKSLPDGAGQPASTWLQNVAETFPAGTTLGSVALDGTTAVVNLNGPAGATDAVLEQVAAQLTWTLVTPRPGPPPTIQSVELEWNGTPFIPPAAICGTAQPRSPVQNLARYPCYDPYPSQPAEFSFAYHGQVWSRCGSEESAQRGDVGQVFPAFRAASAASSQPCGSEFDVDASSTAVPAVAPLAARDGTPSLVAVSSDGAYVAYYAPDKKAVFIGPAAAGPSASAGSLHAVQVGSGVTALSWDRSHDLWIAQNGDVFMIPANGTAISVLASPASADVTALSIAPDGVRVALIDQQAGAGAEVQLAAVGHGVQPSQGQRGSPVPTATISDPVQVGPDILLPDALTWYDADNLIVLAGSSTKTLSEVPVDGQNSSSLQSAPTGAAAITAGGTANALVAGLSGGQLAVSTGLEGPWQLLGVHGQSPAYAG